jgi:hypothetical protein
MVGRHAEDAVDALWCVFALVAARVLRGAMEVGWVVGAVMQ